MITTRPMLPTHRSPTAPGEILREEFLRPLGLGVSEFAERAGIDRISASRILNGSRSVSPDVSVKLGRLFGVSEGFFLQLQTAVDLWHAIQNAGAAGSRHSGQLQASSSAAARRGSPAKLRKAAAGARRRARTASRGSRR